MRVVEPWVQVKERKVVEGAKVVPAVAPIFTIRVPEELKIPTSYVFAVLSAVVTS